MAPPTFTNYNSPEFLQRFETDIDQRMYNTTRRSILGSDGMTKSDCSLAL